ncbi:hypothetical protein ACROYT_G013906 [Oculina patagonica]
MLPELHKYMEIYVRRICPLFAKENEIALFVTNEGDQFPESTIGRRLTQFILKCGVNLGRRMRKVITTEILNRASPQEQANLSRVLAHSEKTSREWNTRPDLTEIGVQAAQTIQCLLDADDKAMYLSLTSKEKAVVDVAGPSSPSPSSPHSSSPGPGDDPELQKVFKVELETNKMITMEVVRQKMARNTIRGRVKQVVNHVNNLVKKSGSAATPPAAKPEAAKISSWLDDFDNPSTRSSRRSE